jgi:hypothetical protein
VIWLHWTLTGLFAIAGAGCLLLVLMQLPGIWVMLILAIGVQLADVAWVHGSDATAGWWAIGIAAVLAIIAEILEGLSSAAGAKVGGGGRRGMWGAFIGGVLGAIVGTPLIPIPVLGTLIGAIAGAFVGALIGETTGANAGAMRDAVAPAAGAAAGRAAGTLIKTGVGLAVWVVLIAGLLIR